MDEVHDRRDAILRAVAVVGEHLLQRGALGPLIDRSLAALGEATGVDRVYVFRVDRTEVDAPHGTDAPALWASQVHEWAAPGVTPQIDNPDLQDVPFEEAGFSRWGDVLSAGGSIDGAVETLPESEQDLLREQQITALAVVPVTVEGEWWGFAGFDLTGPARPFEEAEVAALRTAAGIIGAAIGQRHAWDAVRENERRLAHALATERNALIRLGELDRMKSTFLDAVSHELRTPLTVVLGLASTLRADRLDESFRGTVVDRLAENAERLDRVLARLLDLDRLRADAERLTPVETDVGAVVRTVADAHPVRAARSLRVEADGRAVVDPSVLARITEHLLDNALTHTASGQHVWVSTRTDAAGLRLTVADDGPGVDPEQRDRIFHPFDHGATQRPHAPGTGVGLAVVAGLAQLHAGRAWCDEREGGGAAFHVVLAPVAHDVTDVTTVPSTPIG